MARFPMLQLALAGSVFIASCIVAAGCSNPGDGSPSGTAPDAEQPFFSVADSDLDQGAPTPEPDVVTVPDTSPPPDDGSAEAGEIPPEDTATPSCQEGSPCNDGDPCTFNDQCTNGACSGTSVDCGDNLPCTMDSCVEGVCANSVADGFCLIDGICWTEGQANPMNGCERCISAFNTSQWSANDGFACDDGDPCTSLDTCLDGLCSGQPLNCSDDGNPCTETACVGGACEATALSGASCDDGDPCTLGDTCDKGLCVPGGLKDNDGDGAIDQLCGGDDCDDGSGAVKPGVAEVCDDGVDNDCNGLTDQESEGCEEPPPVTGCTFHTDCYPEGVCAVWAATGEQKCSVPCAGDVDCGLGQICSKLPGSAQVGFCELPGPGSTPNGAACGDDTDCASKLCVNGSCVAACLDEAHCPGATTTCSMVGDIAGGFIYGACADNQPGMKQNGEPCLVGDTYGSEFCSSGHCDIMTFPVEPYLCAPLCKTQSDCLPNQECNVVLYGTSPNTDAIIYDPAILTNPDLAALNEMHDAATGCYTRPIPGGSKTDGTPCSANSQCLGHKCLALLPGDDTTYCTRYCTHDSDCASGMQCKLEAITLNSAFLQAFGTPQPFLWTYVRVCKMCDDCVPNCDMVACGDACCDAGQVCFAGACCSPDCAGKMCGDDGCGGSCGDCPAETPNCNASGQCDINGAGDVEDCLGAFGCIQNCPQNDPGCMATCIAPIAGTQEEANLTAYILCQQVQCTNADPFNKCLTASCWDEFHACILGGQSGTGTCLELLQCLNACPTGDADCEDTCFANADKEESKKFFDSQFDIINACGEEATEQCVDQCLDEGGACYDSASACTG